MKKLIIYLLAAVCASVSVKSMALGDKEAGVLIGVGSTLLLGRILNPQDPNAKYYPYNPNGEFRPFRCSGDSVQCAYERGVWERQYQEWMKEKDAAYQCGRFGHCGPTQ